MVGALGRVGTNVGARLQATSRKTPLGAASELVLRGAPFSFRSPRLARATNVCAGSRPARDETMPSRGGRGGRGGGGGGGDFGGGPGGRGGRLTAGQRPVTEGTRIHIDQQLERFKYSDEEEIVFPPDMNNHDRAVVHACCKKLGLKSKSYGKGDQRRVHVTKPKEFKPQDHEVGPPLTHTRFRGNPPPRCVARVRHLGTPEP